LIDFRPWASFRSAGRCQAGYIGCGFQLPTGLMETAEDGFSYRKGKRLLSDLEDRESGGPAARFLIIKGVSVTGAGIAVCSPPGCRNSAGAEELRAGRDRQD